MVPLHGEHLLCLFNQYLRFILQIAKFWIDALIVHVVHVTLHLLLTKQNTNVEKVFTCLLHSG